MKKTLLFGALVCALNSTAQTSLYSENFNGSTNTFALNSSDLGSGSNSRNLWVVNSSYISQSFTIYCSVIGQNVGFSPNQTPFNYSGNPEGGPFTNFLHITSVAGSNNGEENAHYIPADLCFTSSTNFAKMSASVSTTGMTSTTLSFHWLCGGSSSAFGRVYYSTDDGVTWTQKGSDYNGGTDWSIATLTDANWNNQATLRFAFRFETTNGSNNPVNPSFSIDDVNIVATIDNSSSLSKLDIGSDFELSPNPANENIQISGLEVGNKISIVSINGAIVKKAIATSTEMTLETLNLENGVYFVNIQDSQNTITTKKLVIRK